MSYDDENEPAETLCIVDGCFGIYVPQRFARNYDPAAWGIKPEDAAILLAGPDEDYYWETWDDVLNYARHRDEKGQEWSLEQDGDLFAVRYA